MLLRILIGFYFFAGLLGCTKERSPSPYSFLNLKVEGHKEEIRWETIQTTWPGSTRTFHLEALSYMLDRCSIHLENVLPGTITKFTVENFSFTDDPEFQPSEVSGSIIITEANSNGLRGSFKIRLKDNLHNTPDREVSGEFGIF